MNLNQIKQNGHFEDYLRGIHAETYGGYDDEMPDAFELWLSELGVDELVEYGNAHSKALIEKVVDEIEKAVVPIVEASAKNIEAADKTPKYEYSRSKKSDANARGEFPDGIGTRWSMPREIARNTEWLIKEAFTRFKGESV